MIKIKEVGEPLFYYTGSGVKGKLVDLILQYDDITMPFSLNYGRNIYPYYCEAHFNMLKDLFIIYLGEDIYYKNEEEIKIKLAEIFKVYSIE